MLIDIQTKTVVEKGVWDDVVVLNEIVRVHTKLQFILSADEKRRIQDMVLFKKNPELMKLF